MQYARMKYAHDRRAWVKAADENLPVLRALAADTQHAAAKFYEACEIAGRTDIWLTMRREASTRAIAALNRVLYYEGMRRANLPEGE